MLEGDGLAIALEMDVNGTLTYFQKVGLNRIVATETVLR
jgi:hypothetical protein